MGNQETIVVKCGGSVMSQLNDSFFQSLSRLAEQGYRLVIVHGGGPDIEGILKQLNIQSEFVNGLRKTSAEVLDVVKMVLAGKVNKQLVMSLQACGLNSVGLSGCDGMLLETEAINYEELGYVGEVVNVNDELLHHLMEKEYVPVISSIGANQEGESFNINADLAAGAVAQALGAKQLLFVTDVQGIIKDGELLDEVTPVYIEQLIKDGVIYGGMIPKVKSAIKALSSSLPKVQIVSGKSSFMNENGEWIGTTIQYTEDEAEGETHEFFVSNVSTV
ncbi:acetylglutamate kinase [Priestia abyssalis]|uniref:acetylglutamate kinase n=1 Tax=Priestia abyssalis TaxID=1221450 RepID=UPI0009952A8B|nr:acetylglutamate kinase [Priestia abyssalis]